MILIEIGVAILIVALLLEIITYLIDNEVKRKNIKRRKRK